MLGAPFRCNICGAEGVFSPRGDWREAHSCTKCGSSVRMRGLIHCLTLGLLGESRALPDLDRYEYSGIGLSDWEGYGYRLSSIFNYKNTFYHQEPRLDIARPSARWVQSAHFLISSDVFEHVPVPAMSAFSGAATVLRPGGVLVLTVPYGDNEQTIEHYPAMKDFSIAEIGGEWIMTNRASDGSLTVHRDLVFHGGPGSTLEMRLFSLKDVISNLKESGFINIKIHNENQPKWGIFHPHHHGLPITAQRV